MPNAMEKRANDIFNMVKVGFTLSCPYAFLPLNCLIGNANFTTLCLMSEPSKIVEYSVRTDNKAV